MQVNRIDSQQPNFKGFVGQSMKNYVSSQMERELTDLYARDKKFGPFVSTSIIAKSVKELHVQVQSKLSNFMKKLDPNISIEYEAGVVKLQDHDSRNKIDVFSPTYFSNSGEKTLLCIDSFASALGEKVSDKIGNIIKH